MSVIINPIITNAGLNVFTPLATGIEFTFTHVAVGTGTSAVNANDTALQNEIDRFTIAGGGVIAGGKAVSINALVTNHSNANPQDYNISEIGFYGKDANNNTVLFAIHRQSTTIVRKVAGADIALPFVLGLSALPVENMTVTIDTNTSGALALLGQHVANAHPHTQYKRTLDNTEQLKIANGTANDHAVRKEQLDGAISTEATARSNADTALQTAINNEATARSNADTALQNSKADLGGSSTQTFSAATATANDHVVRKDQLDAKTAIATTIVAGIVKKATQAEMNAGTANVWPDAQTLLNGFSFDSANKEFKLSEFFSGVSVKMGTVTTGNLSAGNNPQTVVFNTPFPNNCLMFFAVPKTSGASDIPNFWVSVNGFNASSAVVWLFEDGAAEQGVGAGFNWLAIGY